MPKTYREMFTEEEIEEDKKDILKMFQDGIPISKMMLELGRGIKYIKMIRAELISDGLITEEEIQEGQARWKEKFPPAQGGLKQNRVYVPRKSTRHQEKIEKKEKTKEQILMLIKAGKTVTDISNELRILDPTVRLYTNELVEENKISEDEVKWNKTADDEIAEAKIDRTTEEYIKNKSKVLQMLKNGYTSLTIRTRLSLTPYDYKVYLTDLVRFKSISYEEIQEKRELKHLQNLQFVATRIKMGDTLSLIQKNMDEELAVNSLRKLVNELNELGIITKEEVIANARTAQKNSFSKGKSLSTEEQIKYIREKVFLGYTPKEIVDSDETGSISMNSTVYQKKIMIKEGVITKEEAERLMEKHRRELLEKKIRFIREKVFLGYTADEIVNSDEKKSISKRFVALQKQRMIDEGIISKEEVERLMQEHKRELLEEQYLADWIIIKAKIRQGLDYDEIAELLKKSKKYIYTVKKFAEGKGEAISIEQIKKYKKKRKKQDEIERQKEAKKIELERQKKEKAQRKEDERIEKIISRSVKEEEDELDGNIFKCEARKVILQEIKKANEQGVLLDPKIYVLCFNLYLYHPEMIDAILLEVIMKGLKLTQKPSDYDRYKNEIKSVIKNELKSELEINFDE